jgi:uroporphyrinogen-III decarboxylase
MLVTGSPDSVKEYCRKLIEVCGVGGGYILGCGASIENPKLENLVAMVEAAKNLEHIRNCSIETFYERGGIPDT